LLNYSETSLFEFRTEETQSRELRILIKREDLNHPFISGNKWWKLKYNLEETVRHGQKTILTFGGAYSNHIYATAAAATELGFKSIGVIRGEKTLPLNATLSFAKESGMHLHYISREAYRNKNEPEFIQQLQKQFGDFYLIPEGGTNEWAVKGCAEFGEKLSKIEFDYLCLPVGTGGTIAGIISGLKGEKEVIGFSSLRGGSFLERDVSKLVADFSGMNFSNWRIEDRYHFGGYAKMTEELKIFMQNIEQNHTLTLDPVYTAKMFYGVLDLVAKNYFQRGSTILVLHTGGLQGRSGFNLDSL